MPVIDHPVHEKVSFKEVPLSTCHSSLPDRSKGSYKVMNTQFFNGAPYQAVVEIKTFHDGICKQPDNSLPECRGCNKPEIRDEARSDS
jgi:hypothetical protein